MFWSTVGRLFKRGKMRILMASRSRRDPSGFRSSLLTTISFTMTPPLSNGFRNPTGITKAESLASVSGRKSTSVTKTKTPPHRLRHGVLHARPGSHSQHAPTACAYIRCRHQPTSEHRPTYLVTHPALPCYDAAPLTRCNFDAWAQYRLGCMHVLSSAEDTDSRMRYLHPVSSK